MKGKANIRKIASLITKDINQTAKRIPRERAIENWGNDQKQAWHDLHFGEVRVETYGEHHEFEVQVFFNELDKNKVLVELYAIGINGDAMIRRQMKRSRQLPGTTQGYYYRAKVSSIRPVTDYTVRLMLNLPDDSVPVETTQILWQQ